MNDLQRNYIKVLRIFRKEVERIAKKELKGIDGADCALSSLVELHYRIGKVIDAIKENK